MPLVRSSRATVCDGAAPWESQWRARSSSTTMSEGSVCGLYWPIVSIVRPSRGERLSATTMRQIGFLREPTRLSLIRTAIGPQVTEDAAPRGRQQAERSAHQLLRVRHLALGELLQHLLHLAKLLRTKGIEATGTK